MSKPLLSALALCLCLGSLPGATSASGQELYLSVYQAGVPNIPSLYTGQTSAQLASTFNSVTTGQIHLFDVEAYYDAAGNLLYDSFYSFDAWNQGQSSIIIDAPIGLVASIQPAHEAAGRRLTDLTSYLAPSGIRLYTAVFNPQTKMENFVTGVTESNWQAVFNAQNAGGFFPTTYETYYDSNGVRIIDAAFRKKDATSDWFFSDISQATFLAKNAQYEAQNLRLQFYETWRDLSGTRRFAARWSSKALSPVPMEFVFDEDLPSFLVTYQSKVNSGRRLIDMSVLEGNTPASSSNYGSGLAGLNGVPDLTLSGAPYLGANVTINMGNSAGTSVLGGLFLGVSQASIPFKGGQLLVVPILAPLLLPLPTAGVVLPTTLPADPTFDGLQFFVQLAVDDDGAPNGISLSRGLQITMGAQD